jgi:adenylate cyclase
LALSPSSAFTYMFGSTLLGWAGEADRAIDWGERAARLSPFDPIGFLAFDGISLGHFIRGRYSEAADAARKAIQVNPSFSVNYVCLVAALARLGQTADAKSAAARLIELQPSFSISKQCAAVGVVSSLTAALTNAVCPVGLPA